MLGVGSLWRPRLSIRCNPAAKDSRPPCMTNVHALVSQGDWRSWSREENFVPLRLWTSRVRLFPPAFDMRNCYMLRLDR